MSGQSDHSAKTRSAVASPRRRAATSRRRFISTTGQLLAWATFSNGAAAQPAQGFSQGSEAINHPYVGVSASGRTQSEFALAHTHQRKHARFTSSFRGHGLAQHPQNLSQVVMVGRRPGHQAILTDSHTGQVIRTFNCHSDRYFCGHACFNQDGRWLFCSQADRTTHQGSIAVYDSASAKFVSEWNTHGIEPHELVFDSQSNELVIANGGLIRSQDGQRRLLNRDSMSSSLVRLNADTGQMLERIEIKQPFSSLRHLAIANDQTISLALQYQTDKTQAIDEVWRAEQAKSQPPYLTATYHPDYGIRPLAIPQRVWEICQGYIGSTAICTAQHVAAFTSPRGDLVLFWDTRQQNLLSMHRFNDVCGVSTTPDQGYFALTNSHGSVRFIDTRTQQENLNLRQKFPHQSWDNHLLMIPQTQQMMSL